MHTHFRKNKKILLIYKDGTQEIDRYNQVEGKYLKLMSGKEVRLDKLRAICIYKKKVK